MNVNRGEAETAIRALCYQWAAERSIRPNPNADPREFHPSFSAFTRWMQEEGYDRYLRFRSTMGPEYDAEMWFDQEFKQTWRR
jgi:hypothetical protein